MENILGTIASVALFAGITYLCLRKQRVGPRGEKGERGETGEVGLTGHDGAQGEQGERGAAAPKTRKT